MNRVSSATDDQENEHSYHSITSTKRILIHISTKNVQLYTKVNGEHCTAVDSCCCPRETCKNMPQVKYHDQCCMRNCICLSLSRSALTAIFPGEPGLASFINRVKDDGSGGDNWSYKTCKLSPPTN